MGVCKKLRALVWVVAFQTLQHGRNAALLIVQKPFRGIPVQPLPQKKVCDPSIQARLYVVEEAGEKAEVMPRLCGNDVLIDRIQLRRRGRELVHMGDFKHGEAAGVSSKRIFCKSLFHSLTTPVISNSSAPPSAAPPVSFPLHMWRTSMEHCTSTMATLVSGLPGISMTGGSLLGRCLKM